MRRTICAWGWGGVGEPVCPGFEWTANTPQRPCPGRKISTTTT